MTVYLLCVHGIVIIIIYYNNLWMHFCNITFIVFMIVQPIVQTCMWNVPAHDVCVLFTVTLAVRDELVSYLHICSAALKFTNALNKPP